VNHTAETIATLDTSLAALRRWRRWRRCRAWRREGQRSMRPVAIVMIRENGKDPLEMLVVQAPTANTKANERIAIPNFMKGLLLTGLA
jgi:hypothetical protein